jgi:hypothetical protein
MPGWLRWTLLAVLGLMVAAGISVAASKLVSQRIGLASEPLSAGEELAPSGRDGTGPPNDRRSRQPQPPVTTTTTTATAPPPSPTPTTTGAPYTGPPTTSTASPAPSGGGGGGEAEHEGGDD